MAASDPAATSQGQCSIATLKGRYLFAHSGTILPPAFGETEPIPGTDTVTVRVGAGIALNNVTFPFTYTVSADCTGRYVVTDGPSFNLFVSPKGDEVGFISTAPPGNYVSGIDHRVSNK